MKDPRTDDTFSDALGRELEQALAVDPSVSFVPRVRSQVAAQSHERTWRLPWTWLAAGSAAMAIAAAVLVFRPAAPAPVAGRPGLVPTLPTASQATAWPPAARVAAPKLPSTPHPRSAVLLPHAPARSMPELLIAEDESATLKRLIARFDRGIVEGPVPGGGGNAGAALQPAVPVLVVPIAAMAPIEIEPLGFSAPAEGERQ